MTGACRGLSEAEEGVLVQATEVQSGAEAESPRTIHYDGDGDDMTPTEPDDL